MSNPVLGKLKHLFDTHIELVIEGLNHIARTLNGEYEKAYWRGYYDGFQGFKSVRDEK